MSNDTDLLKQLRSSWLEVLDELERQHRTAWLALFDARISRVTDGCVFLDFSDRDKFAGAHTFDVGSRPDYLDALSAAISACFAVQLTVALEGIAGEQ